MRTLKLVTVLDFAYYWVVIFVNCPDWTCHALYNQQIQLFLSVNRIRSFDNALF